MELTPDQIWMRDPVLQCREELIYYEEVFEFIRCGKTPASTDGEYNKLVSVAGVNPPSDKHSAGALNGVERRPQGFGKEECQLKLTRIPRQDP